MKAPRNEDASKHLPLKPRELHVLLALAERDKHGYAILKDVARRTKGRLRMNISSLYMLIHRFEDKGLVCESDDRPEPALDDERRCYYRLTLLGRRVGQAETERLREMVAMVEAHPFLPAPKKAKR